MILCKLVLLFITNCKNININHTNPLSQITALWQVLLFYLYYKNKKVESMIVSKKNTKVYQISGHNFQQLIQTVKISVHQYLLNFIWSFQSVTSFENVFLKIKVILLNLSFPQKHLEFILKTSI